jgi:hypothetical protein
MIYNMNLYIGFSNIEIGPATFSGGLLLSDSFPIGEILKFPF